jgi:O-antigen ligase
MGQRSYGLLGSGTVMEKMLELVLALVIIGTALAFGGVQPISYSVMEVVLFLALLLLLLSQTRRGRIDVHLPLWPILFVLLVGLQVIPFPASVIARLSPSPLPNLGVTGTSHGSEVWSTFSIFPHDTVTALLKFVAYLSVFALAAYLFDSGKRKSTLIQGLIFVGCFEATYGIIQYLTGWQKIFTYSKRFYTEDATGTYINHNHFAGLLELIVPFVLALAFYSFQRGNKRRQDGGSKQTSRGKSPSIFQSVFYFFLAVVLMVALVFSRSRGGILASLFSLIFVALLAQLKVRRKAWVVGVFLVLLGMIGYGLWIGLDPVLARFEQLREPGYLQLEGRIAIWKDALPLVRNHPLVGTGLGTFGMVFRHYQTERVGNYVDHAHNDYLELASDTGLIGAALLFLPIFLLLIRMMISFLDDPRRYRRSVTLGCIGSTVAILIHSVTDFNLQIPANALIFSVVLGIGYKASCIERREPDVGERQA